MTKYCAIALATKYWRPRENYLSEIIETVKNRVETGDFVVISEKALSTALDNMVDESSIKPHLNARLIARFWMRIGWGYFFGIASRFGPRLLRRLRAYPIEAGSRHKQVALQHEGLIQALMFGSEGGIDGSNLPYSLVCLPLKNANKQAKDIRKEILLKLKKKVTVIIVDTDKTYLFRNFYFTPRPKPMKGINSKGGFCVFLLGRLLKLKKKPTPLAVAGKNLHAEEALTIANIADKARGPGSGATIWDMAARFKVETTSVTWEMLETARHKPIVIVRKKLT